jgi:CBS domain-containing protein
MTISLAVILLELTGVVNWALPIMVSLVVARWTGNTFNEGLYDVHIHLKNMPFLEYKPTNKAQQLQVSPVAHFHFARSKPKNETNESQLAVCLSLHRRSLTMPPHTHIHLPTPLLICCDQVRDIMVPDPIVMHEVMRAGEVYDILDSCKHNGFAVVGRPVKSVFMDKEGKDELEEVVSRERMESTDSAADGDRYSSDDVFKGLIRRQHLATLLKYRDLCTNKPEPNTRIPKQIYHRVLLEQSHATGLGGGSDAAGGPAGTFTAMGDSTGVEFSTSRTSRLTGADRVSQQSMLGFGDHDPDSNCLSYVDMEYDFPKYPTMAEVAPLSAAERNMWLDLTPYMNQSPPVVFDNATASRAYHYFRSMGLRHLTVISEMNQVVGTITRHELTHRFLHQIVHDHEHSHSGGVAEEKNDPAHGSGGGDRVGGGRSQGGLSGDSGGGGDSGMRFFKNKDKPLTEKLIGSADDSDFGYGDSVEMDTIAPMGTPPDAML